VKFGGGWQMLVRREKFARELEEEMRLHRELKEKELIADGLDASEARYAANRQFGNAMYLRERGREAWGWRWLEDFMRDLRFGARDAEAESRIHYRCRADACPRHWCQYGDFLHSLMR